MMGRRTNFHAQGELVAVDGEVLEDHGEEVLAHDDVVEYHDAHEDDADEKGHLVEVGAPVIGDKERERQGDDDGEEERRHGDREGWADLLLDEVAHVLMEVVRFGKLEEKKLPHLVPEAAVKGVEAAVLGCLQVEEHGLVHAVGRDPCLYLDLRRVLAELPSRHSLRRREDVEQEERDEADPHHGGNGEEDPANDVVDHYLLLLMEVITIPGRRTTTRKARA